MQQKQAQPIGPQTGATSTGGNPQMHITSSSKIPHFPPPPSPQKNIYPKKATNAEKKQISGSELI